MVNKSSNQNTLDFEELIDNSYMKKMNQSRQEIPEFMNEKLGKLKDLIWNVQNSESLNPKEQLQMQNKFDVRYLCDYVFRG